MIFQFHVVKGNQPTDTEILYWDCCLPNPFIEVTLTALVSE